MLARAFMFKAKKTRKLTLETKTIKQLSNVELTQAAGALSAYCSEAAGCATMSRVVSCSCAPGGGCR
mgnify:CR=1 FL=1